MNNQAIERLSTELFKEILIILLLLNLLLMFKILAYIYFQLLTDQMKEDRTQKHRSSDYKFETNFNYRENLRADRITEFLDREEITKEDLENIFKKYVFYDQKQNSDKDQKLLADRLKLKKPPKVDVKFPFFESSKQRIKNIMVRALNSQQLKLAQFNQLEKEFKLSSNQIKMMSYSDPIIIQTLRFAIFNKQQVPGSLVKVINQMAKTNMNKKMAESSYFFSQSGIILVLNQDFQPPLDLYLQFVDEGLIQPGQQQLMQVFVRNRDFFNNKMADNKQFCSTISQKKRLIFNQFPYMMEIFERINSLDSSCFNYGELRSYFRYILPILSIQSEVELLERYLPETKIRYKKIKQKLSSADIQFLFIVLKNLQDLTTEDFKILYDTKPNKTPILQQYQTKSWSEFGKIQELCSNILTNKNFYLSIKLLKQLNEILNFEKHDPEKLIQNNLILAIFREESYKSQLFQKSIIRNISFILKNLPDKKRKKQCGYILLMQYFKIIEQNSKKRAQTMVQYTFPESQLDKLLDEGRQLSLDLLLSQKEQNLILDNETKYLDYMKILKRVINCTKNKSINTKATKLYQKITEVNSFTNKDLQFYEQNLIKTNDLIDFIEPQVKKGHKISKECVDKIVSVLLNSKNASIKKSCLITLRYVIKNIKKGQLFPQNFDQSSIQSICNLFFQENLTEECKNEVIKLVVFYSYFKGNQKIVEFLLNFLVQVYLKASVNSSININSSYCLYSLALNFIQKGENYKSAGKSFFEKVLNKIFRKSRQDFLSSKSSYNILCAIIAFVKNEVQLQNELIQQLMIVGLKNKKFGELSLIPVLLQLKNPNSEDLTQKNLMNICQILKKNENNQMIGVLILQNYFKKYWMFPFAVKIKIEEIIKNSNNETDWIGRLSTFYNNIKNEQKRLVQIKEQQKQEEI